MTMYANLAQVKNDIKATNTNDDTQIVDAIRQVSRRVDAHFASVVTRSRFFFAPYTEQREWLVEAHRINTWLNTFYFGAPLLSLTGVVIGNTTMTVNTNVEAYPTLRAPFYTLRLQNRSDNWYRFCTDNCDPLLVTITGTWGWHRDFANAYLAVDTVQDNPLTAASTSLTVADIDGSDDLGFSPRISVGSLLRIDSELLEVTAVNTTTNVATVRRGMNGTTAAEHTQTTDVEVWQVDESIRRAVTRQVAFQYARRGAYESASITDVGIINFPSDTLAEFRHIVQELAYQ